MRAFIALEIPDRIRESIAGVLLGYGTRYGIKIIPPENMHITLEFLGEISEETASAVSCVMASLDAGKFEAALGKISTFCERSSVAFMDMGVGSNDAIAIHDSLHGKLSAMQGIRLEKREFFPHLSVARGSSKNLKAFAAGMSKEWTCSETFTISRLALKRSMPGGANAKYETIFEKGLS